MMQGQAAIYTGRVVHKRLRPTAHALDYGVFALLVDVDAIANTAQKIRLLSYNKANLFSINDRDHGAGDGTPLSEIARAALRDAGLPSDGRRILLLTYPRALGYVFNPLSVFFVFEPGGELESLIYQVSNTFGERKSYVLGAGRASTHGVYAQSCRKEMFVSPFAPGSGQYGFHITAPADSVVVGVTFSDAAGPLIKTHFRGARRSLTDGALFRLAITFPLLTLKVMAAIHYEALKLWLKGVPLAERHVSPAYSTSPHIGQKQG